MMLYGMCIHVIYIFTELEAAKLKSNKLICLRRGNPAKTVYEVEWSYDNREPMLVVDHFRVIATPTPADDNTEREVSIADCTCRSTKLELQPGTTYSLSVETHFRGNIEPQMSKKGVQISVPVDDEGKSKALSSSRWHTYITCDLLIYSET